MYKFLIICCLFLFQKISHAGNLCDRQEIFANSFKENHHIELIREADLLFLIQERPSPLLNLFKKKQKNTKKLTAALLAFPFPFGIVGLHRIYLGTAPYVPVVYIASLGGVFGLLPLVDFCVLLANLNNDRYLNDTRVFMWVE